MLFILFLIIAPCYRIFLYSYRYIRSTQLKKIYDTWLTSEINDKRGNRISIFNYSEEITRLVRLSGNSSFVFSSAKKHFGIENDAAALQKAIGIFKYEIKRSLFPHTYLIAIINLPKTISGKVGIQLNKAVLLLIYILYAIVGFIDVRSILVKIVEILG